MPDTPENSRNRLLAATIDLVRANGYAATRVEDICAAAGVTKGSFFHHFASKEELAAAAGEHWGERSMQLFAQAPYLRKPDALDPGIRALACVSGWGPGQNQTESDVVAHVLPWQQGVLLEHVRRVPIRANEWLAVNANATGRRSSSSSVGSRGFGKLRPGFVCS